MKILQRFGEIKNFQLHFHKSGVREGEPCYCFVEYKTCEVSVNARNILHDDPNSICTGDKRPTIIVFFLNFQEAESALHGLNGKLALSKHLTVNWARFKGTTYVVSVYIITRICEHFCIPVDIF